MARGGGPRGRGTVHVYTTNTYIDTYIHTRILTYTYIDINAHAHICKCTIPTHTDTTPTHTHMYIYTYIYIYIYIHVYARTCAAPTSAGIEQMRKIEHALAFVAGEQRWSGRQKSIAVQTLREHGISNLQAPTDLNLNVQQMHHTFRRLSLI